MIIEYYLINPTGNITILVKSRVPIEKQPEIAELLMKNEPSAQQVGFVSGDYLRMAGGEFCGNATISTAALLLLEKNAEIGKEEELSLRVSGADNRVRVCAERISDEEFVCRAEMPKPISVEKCTLKYSSKEYSFTAVDFGSILHLVYEGKIEKVLAEEAIKLWSRELGRECIGIMHFDEKEMSLSPLVYVQNPPSLFWESSCASGSSATGIYLAVKKNERLEASFSQPGGVLSVIASPQGDIILKGRARITQKSIIEI